MKKALILMISLCLNACGLNSATNNQVEKYGGKVSYTGNRELKFTDFSVRFSGKREKPYPAENSALKMVFYDFEVTKGDKKQTVSWTSGTGDIAPSFFYVDGADYVLELAQSDVFKEPLGEGNLVIWKRADFEKAKKNKNK